MHKNLIKLNKIILSKTDNVMSLIDVITALIIVAALVTLTIVRG